MKLEDLRQRFQEPELPKPGPKPRKRPKKAAASRPVPPMHQNCRSSVASPDCYADMIDDLVNEDVGGSTKTKTKIRDWFTKASVMKCDKCGKSFTPALALGYVPATCAKCASYL